MKRGPYERLPRSLTRPRVSLPLVDFSTGPTDLTPPIRRVNKDILAETNITQDRSRPQELTPPQHCDRRADISAQFERPPTIGRSRTGPLKRFSAWRHSRPPGVATRGSAPTTCTRTSQMEQYLLQATLKPALTKISY